MTVQNFLKSATEKLTKAGITTARLDCLILLEDITGKDRGWLFAHPEFSLQGATLKKLEAQLKRRIKHEPLAYIRGKSEFYGREFIVSKDTLEPRPETETIIEVLKKLRQNWQKPYLLEIRSLTDKVFASFRIVDVGTGSGCLAITAKLEFPEAEVIGTDISPACLKIARNNAKILGADIKLYQGDLLQPLSLLRSPFAVLLCNLPYVPDSHTINQAVMFEPTLAIFGGEDGLDLYRKLFAQISNLRHKPQYIFTESLPFQHNSLRQIAQTAGYKPVLTDDFINVFAFQN